MVYSTASQGLALVGRRDVLLQAGNRIIYSTQATVINIAEPNGGQQRTGSLHVSCGKLYFRYPTCDRRALPPSTLNRSPVTAGQRLTTPARAFRVLSCVVAIGSSQQKHGALLRVVQDRAKILARCKMEMRPADTPGGKPCAALSCERRRRRVVLEKLRQRLLHRICFVE